MADRHRYARSEMLLERALKSIPLGTQTFSKSYTHFPHGVSPYFVSRGHGGHIWDEDGNEYLDFSMGLTAVSLGYNDPDVNEAVKQQLEVGIIFSLPHQMEMAVAEAIIDMVPCAEAVRFGKNGSDATAGAVRLARAFTNRDHVFRCGYHGWHDWYIGSTSRNKGVPKAVQELTHVFEYNQIDSLDALFKQYPDDVACVIMEPMNSQYPEPGFLEEVKELTHQNRALLIFDEMITGFRFARGGAQELFGVIPDLACIGKGLSNGYPLSAVVGRADLMKLFEEIFFSSTAGGETLSLAAALSTITKCKNEPVIETLKKRGDRLMDGVHELLRQFEITHIFELSGHPSWSFLKIKDSGGFSESEIRTLFMQETLARGIIMLGTHDICYAHSEEDIEGLIQVYSEVFPIIGEAVAENNLLEKLRCDPLKPLFEVRKDSMDRA